MTPAAIARQIREAGADGVSCQHNGACAHLHLDLRACDKLRFHQPGDLTVGADAGMTVAALDRVLAPHGQFVPLEVENPDCTTLGAAVACHLSGPLRQRYGTVRDFTIGMELASAEGKLVHCGGRVVKNVAGYDWMKVMIGARGALGIITGVNFKVFPRPMTVETVRFANLRWDEVEGIRAALLRSPLRPLAIELEAGGPGGNRSVSVTYAGSPAVQARYRNELAKLAANVEFVPGGPPPTPPTNYSCAPSEAATIFAGLPRDVVVRGRLGLGVFSLDPAPPPAAIPAGAARLMQALKRQLDTQNVMHGDTCV